MTTVLWLMMMLMSSIPVEAKKKKYEGDFEFVDEVSFDEQKNKIIFTKNSITKKKSIKEKHC